MSDSKSYGKEGFIPVFAVNIKSITKNEDGSSVIEPAEGQKITDNIYVTESFVQKFNPKPGGYYIMCEGGLGLYSE